MAFIGPAAVRLGPSSARESAALCSRQTGRVWVGAPLLARSTHRSTLRPVRKNVVQASDVTYTSDKELEALLKSNPGPLLVVFSATWCGPCVMLTPELETLAERMGDRMKIVKIDSDEYPDYCSAIGVRGLPSLYFISNGELKFKMEGAEKARNLEQMAEHFFFDGPEPVLDRPPMPQV